MPRKRATQGALCTTEVIMLAYAPRSVLAETSRSVCSSCIYDMYALAINLGLEGEQCLTAIINETRQDILESSRICC